jgi:hypothetical protein
MASTTVKKSSSKKSAKGYPINRCSWCDRFGEMTSRRSKIETSFGRRTGESDTRYYCDKDCLKLHCIQESSIDIKKNLADLHRVKDGISREYKKGIIHLKEESDETKEVGARVFTMIKYLKSRIEFEEGLLKRERKDVLTMKRYKCLKLAGDLFEGLQGNEQLARFHDRVLDDIYYFNDNDYNDEKGVICGAIAHTDLFGTD